MNLTDKTVIGFDFGTKYIGVAVGQTVTYTANPLASLAAKNGIPDWEKVTQLIQSWQPDALIVGIPFAQNGAEHKMTHAARQFADALKTRYKLPLHTVDERYTTVEAKRHLFEQGGFKALDKNSIDGLAAKIIVESWLKDQQLN